MLNGAEFNNQFCFRPCYSLAARWQKLAVRRCVPLNQTCGPTTSALWAHSHGTLSCRTLTATGSPSIPALVMENPRPRTTRNLLLRNQSSPLLPKELTCTREPSSLSPSSSLMWFTGPYTCDYLHVLSCIINPPLHSHEFFLDLIIFKKFNSKVNVENCESYPWLLRRKLCIIINNNIIIITFIFT